MLTLSASSLSPPKPTTFTLLPPKPPILINTNLLTLFPKRGSALCVTLSPENGSGVSTASVIEDPAASPQPEALPTGAAAAAPNEGPMFSDPKWVGGTWDLKQFRKNEQTDWDAVIDAEVKRRKWTEENPISSSNDYPVLFDTSVIPWWSWVKRFHLPEAELLNGRAAMVGFFMAYFVDSLTGVGVVDQMGNFFCKTLLLLAILGILLIRKKEDIENIKKLIEETTFYDKQWQATWQDENASGSRKDS